MNFTELHSIIKEILITLSASPRGLIGTSFEMTNGKLIEQVQARRGGKNYHEKFLDSTGINCVPGALRDYGPGAAAEGLPWKLSIGAANNFAAGESRQLIQEQRG